MLRSEGGGGLDAGRKAAGAGWRAAAAGRRAAGGRRPSGKLVPCRTGTGRAAGRALPRGVLAAAVLVCGLPALAPGGPSPPTGGGLGPAPALSLGLAAQEEPAPPAETVADEYLRSVEAGAWRAAAARLHPDALLELRETLRILIEPDASGRLLDALAGGATLEAYLSRGGRELFVSVLEALERESPGIVNAMTDRSTEVLGAVAEGDTLRHVLYRLQWRLSGAEPELRVTTLAPDAQGRWRIRSAPELESLRPALRGLVLPRPP